MVQINHQRPSADENVAIDRAAEDVYDLLIEKACDVGAAMFERRIISGTDEERSIACSDLQMKVAQRMIAHMLRRTAEI